MTSGQGRLVIGTTLVAFWTTVAASGQTPGPPSTGPSELDSLIATGARQLEASEFENARQTFEEAICRATALDDAASLEKGWSGIARARWSVGDNTASIEANLRALAIQSRLLDPERLAYTSNAVGLDLYSTGHHDEALGFYMFGLEQNPSPSTRALLLLNIGLVDRFQGRFADAETVLQEALALRRIENKPRPTALTLNALGTVARATGHYARALEYNNEALSLRRAAKDRFGQAQTLNNIANVYGDQGEFERALEIHREALRIAREIGYTRQIGLSTNNIGAALDDLGRPGEALVQAKAAIALYRKTGDRTNLADSLSQAGGYQVELGETEQARILLSEALELGRAIGEPEREIVSLEGLAQADLKDGKAPDALARLDPALEIAVRSGFAGFEWKIRLDRARALRALEGGGAGIADLTAAKNVINVLRTRVGTDAGKIGFLDRSQEVFEELADELSATSRESEALETAEAARARALADLLSQRQMSGKAADRSALAEIRGAQARARAAAAADSGHGAEIDADVGRLKQRNPELASLISVESPLFDEIRQIAARLNATILEYLVTRSECHAWVVTPGGEIHATHRQVDRDFLAGRVRAVREELEKADPNRARSRRLSRSLRELDDLLLAPLERWLPVSPDGLVLIVPHGPLALVPYAALTDVSGRVLADRHTIALAPAVSVFRYTGSKGPMESSRRQPRILLVADPVPPRGSGLSRLPGSRREVEGIARRLGSGARTLIGPKATEAAFKREAPDFAILHLATHGLISEDRPLDSSILLGEGEGEDGYLRVDEIFGLDLHAGLVVLSGCRTGLGRLSGDGILGMTRALLFAGTPTVVVSQWDVSDRATAFLMDRFYAALAAGRGKAAALRTAQLQTRRRYPHPSLWAGFVLVGEPR